MHGALGFRVYEPGRSAYEAPRSYTGAELQKKGDAQEPNIEEDTH